MNTLKVTIKKQYFDEIKTGIKKKEYREITSYWCSRLINRNYEFIELKNGYSANAPTIKLEYLGCDIEEITHPFFGENPIKVFAIKLGKLIE